MGNGLNDKMSWEKLMSTKRYQGHDAPKSADHPSEVRSPFVKDADKIIYCSAFRRLKDKTQVHQFPGSDYVRTRLTHSLEVASVGRSLGMALGRHLEDQGQLEPKDKSKKQGKSGRARAGDPKWAGGPPDRADFGNVVAAAGLAHDIGNPPFGHAGERAIRHWFARDSEHLATENKRSLLEALTSEKSMDLRHFEGNAQGFRILTRLQAWRDEGGLRLTCATLGAFQKYPHGSWRTDDVTGEKCAPEKFGYFQDDRAAMKTVAKEVGLKQLDKKEGRWCRHPLALLVEAADDICNSVADIEDGYKYGKIEFKRVEELLRAIAKTGWVKELNPAMDPAVTKYGHDEQIAYLRAQAIGALVRQAFDVYRRYEDEIMTGAFSGGLMTECSSRDVLIDIEDLCRTKLFQDASNLESEVAGYEVIRHLLEIYAEALLEWENNAWEDNALPFWHKNVYALLEKIVHIPKSRYPWLLCVTDHVSGMTDQYAVDLYRRLRGITAGRVAH